MNDPIFIKDTISWDTNGELFRAAEAYADIGTDHRYVAVGQFAALHTGMDADDVRTLITCNSASILAVSATDNQYTHKLPLMNIDLYPNHPSILVAPGLYDLDGNYCYNGLFMRKPLRLLSELEGRALGHDLRNIVALHAR